MKHTISALMANTPGVLAEMAMIFREEYQVNITSISAGETENPEVTHMVVCVEASDEEVQRITDAIAAMDVVLEVDDLSRKEFVDRELVLIKVYVTRETTSQVMQILEVFRANVVGMGKETLTAELSGDEDRVDGLITMLKPFGIKSLCRTGRIALKRGDD